MNSSVIELNVGGRMFTTKVSTVTENFPISRLAEMVNSFREESQNSEVTKPDTDGKGRLFIDRDPQMFSHILQYLRDCDVAKTPQSDSTGYSPPHLRWLQYLCASDRVRFEDECHFFRLALPGETPVESSELQRSTLEHHPFSRSSSDNILQRIHGRNVSIRRPTAGPKYISLGYRATYAVNRDAFTTDKFRRITRITVSGCAAAAKEVFDDDINDSRDPDRQPAGGYTSRYYLKHNHLEKAFESLGAKGYQLVASTSSGSKTVSAHTDEYKQWTAYLEYVFYRH